MPSYSATTMLDSDLQNFANSVKDAIAAQLDMPELDNYLIVVGRPNVWGRFKDKFFGKDPKDDELLRLMVVKLAREDKKDK